MIVIVGIIRHLGIGFRICRNSMCLDRDQTVVCGFQRRGKMGTYTQLVCILQMNPFTSCSSLVGQKKKIVFLLYSLGNDGQKILCRKWHVYILLQMKSVVIVVDERTRNRAYVIVFAREHKYKRENISGSPDAFSAKSNLQAAQQQLPTNFRNASVVRARHSREPLLAIFFFSVRVLSAESRRAKISFSCQFYGFYSPFLFTSRLEAAAIRSRQQCSTH